MDPDEEAVPYNEFLALARDEGLVALEIQVLQAPNETNGRSAVVLATARSAQAGFSAVGEASPRSAPEAWHSFLTTLAELRAKARALRDMTGLDHAVQEELAVPYVPAGGFDETSTYHTPPRLVPSRSAAPATDVRPTGPAVTAAPTARPQMSPPSRPSVPPIDHDEDENEDGMEDTDEPTAPHDAIATRRARTAAQPARLNNQDVSGSRATAAPDGAAEDDEQALPPDHEGIAPDMLAKLKKLAVSIADLEGAEITDAEATKRLDDFFLRAFKHPLSRASRLEGQRVVQYLSNDLVKRRGATGEEKD